MSDEPTRQGKVKAKVAATPSSTPPPRMIGRFIIDGELGAGGMGVVLAGHDPDLDRKVAIKMLLDEDDADEDDSVGGGSADREAARLRLRREAQAMARLRHPNVVTVHEAGTHDGQIYLAMEYVPGGTLRNWLTERRLLADDTEAPTVGWQDVLAMFVPAGRGLAAAHDAGLVHRDFKPDNVMVDDHGRALVTDFGLAGIDARTARPGRADLAHAPLSQTLTSTGAVMGSPRFMSPEQHLAKDTDARTDQFSFCVALYEPLFGVRAFAGESYEVVRQHALDGVVTEPRPDREVPARIRAAVLRGLRPDPAERWPSMNALLAELAWRPTPRRVWVAAAAASLAMLVVVFLLVGRGGAADPEAAGRAAERAAQACDCELLTVELPPGATITGIRATPVGPATAVEIQPTGQLAVPRGHHVLDYRVDGATYGYALVSAGAGATRTLVLPAPELRDGFAFVPGGDVSIGDPRGGGDPGAQPVAVVHLEPYLIARTQAPAVTYADALAAVRAARVRLPTAAEWEWAAWLGVADGMLGDGWEWTATRFAPYPYADDGRDDPFAAGDTSEIRGGRRGDGDAPIPSRRLAGQRAGKAEVRRARTPLATAPPRELAVRVIEQVTRPEPTVERTEEVVHPADLTALHRFVVAWSMLDDPPALQLVRGQGAHCPVVFALGAAGVDRARVEIVASADPAAVTMTVRWNPIPGFVYEKEPFCISDSSERAVFERICFDGDAVRPSGELTIKYAAEVLATTPGYRLEIRVHVAPGTADGLALSQRRAEAVRARMIAAGVAGDRLVARGFGDSEPIADVPAIDPEARARRVLLGETITGDPCVPGAGGDSERVELRVVPP